ncbi:hypothetical protein FACS1894181_06210 [Bacteroidia bacterium]|nr:hypothetical protein FACS1894181_06210 [Bacteroidia bacterium]
MALALGLALSQGGFTAQAQKGVSKSFANSMAAGKYSMKFRSEQNVAGQEATFEAEQFVSGDKMALVGKMEEHHVKIVVRDGKGYMIDDTSKKIFAMPDAGAAKDMGFNVSKIEATGYGHETFLGKNLPYDEYTIDKGRMRMYVNAGRLAGFQVMLKGEASLNIEITDFSDKVDESVFTIPAGYEKVGF